MSININQLLPSKNPVKANEQTKIIKPNNVTTTNDKAQDTKATIVDTIKPKRKRGRPRKTKTNEEHKRSNKKNRNHISKEQLKLIKQQEHENRVAKEEYMKQQRRKHAIISNYVKKQKEDAAMGIIKQNSNHHVTPANINNTRPVNNTNEEKQNILNKINKTNDDDRRVRIMETLNRVAFDKSNNVKDLLNKYILEQHIKQYKPTPYEDNTAVLTRINQILNKKYDIIHR